MADNVTTCAPSRRLVRSRAQVRTFKVSRFARVGMLVASILLCGRSLEAQVQVLSGQYTGNNAAARPIAVGFQPDVVIVKAVTAAGAAVIRTSTMNAGEAYDWENYGGGPYTTSIQSLDANGFTVGTHATVNLNPVVYHWIAFRAVAGEMKVGKLHRRRQRQPLDRGRLQARLRHRSRRSCRRPVRALLEHGGRPEHRPGQHPGARPHPGLRAQRLPGGQFRGGQRPGRHGPLRRLEGNGRAHGRRHLHGRRHGPPLDRRRLPARVRDRRRATGARAAREFTSRSLRARRTTRACSSTPPPTCPTRSRRSTRRASRSAPTRA